MFDKDLLQLPRMKGAFALSAFCALLLAALACGQAILLGIALAKLWAASPVGSELLPIALGIGCFLGRQLVIFLRDGALDRLANTTAGELRRQVIHAAFSPENRLIQRRGSAAVVESIAQGAGQVEDYLRIMPPKICGVIATALPVLIASFLIDWISGIILLVSAPVIFFFLRLLGRQAKDRARAQFQRYQRLSNHFLDTLRALPTLVGFGTGAQEDERVYKVSEDLRVASMKSIATATLSSCLLDLTATLGVAAVAMMLAFRLMDGSVGLATGLTALMLAPEFYTPIRSFAADFHASLDAKQALAQILDILGAQPSETGKTPFPDTLNWDDRSTLEWQGLTFRYDGDAEGAWREVALPPGSIHGFGKVALVGRSGTGKTTLTHLLSGFLSPASGRISVNGQPVDSLAWDQWSRLVHYIPQNPYIFRDTLGNNLRFYNPQASDDAVARAVEAVGLTDMVAKMPEGLDTLIGDGGRGLSGGQAQRIALARTLLDERPILIFDEPTAHLDIQTEYELKECMLPLMEGKLVVFATHRHHWLSAMDEVIALDDAEVQPASAEGGSRGI